MAWVKRTTLGRTALDQAEAELIAAMYELSAVMAAGGDPGAAKRKVMQKEQQVLIHKQAYYEALHP